MLKKIIKYTEPPKKWKFIVILISACLCGVVAYTFYISNAASYLSDNPETCLNCHVMAPQYATWKHSSHKEVATCNDCHVPHDNVVEKYLFKAKDGLRHSTIFTMRGEPQVIKIHEEGINVVQANCERCHNQLNEKVSTLGQSLAAKKHGNGKLCWDCHREVPHGRVHSNSSTPDARVPTLSSPTPDWLKEMLQEESEKQNKN